jgi:preprotein translocase subunit SecF
MLLGLGSILGKGGLRYDIDFTGGTLVEVRLARAMPVGTIRSQLTEAGLGESIIQVFGDPRDVLIRTHTAKTDAAELSRRVADALGGHGAGTAEIRRVEYVGPQIGQELRRQALYAVLAALAGHSPVHLDALRLPGRRGHDRERGARCADLPSRSALLLVLLGARRGPSRTD